MPLDTPVPSTRPLAAATTATPLWRPRGWVAAVALLTPLLYLLAWSNGPLDFVLPRAEFLSLHTLLETVAVAVGLVVAVTARYVLDERERRIGGVVALAFLVVAVLDLLHMVSYAGMPDFVTSNASSHKSIVLWLLARTVAAGALIVWCFPWRPGLLVGHRATLLMAIGVVVSLGLGTLAVWRPQAFPSTFEPGVGLTPLKQAVEGLIMVLMGLALAGQLQRMAGLDPEDRSDEAPVRDALLLMILGEFFFVLYGQEVTTSANLLGHVYKVMAYGCLSRSVFLHRVRRPYLRLLQARQELEQRSAEYRELLELAPVGVVVTDGQGRIQIANRAMESMFGYRRDELIDRPVEMLLPPALQSSHVALRTGWAAGNAHSTRLRSGLQGQRKDGTLIDVEIAIEKAPVADGWRLTACLTDVSHRRAYEVELERRAMHDSLTGLPNRWCFLEQLRHVIAKATQVDEPVGLALLDLVGFKQINETHGSAVADVLLKEVARSLDPAVLGATFVARLGGDVFAVIARGVGAGDPLATLARGLLQALAPGVRAGSVEWPVTAAIGLASYPADALEAERLLRCTELALDESKRQGRGQTTRFNPALGRRVQQEQRVHARLQAALHADALALHYQPQVGVANGQIQGFEALVRWTDAELGAVPPTVFIPVAESTGLIGAVGEAVLRMACRQLRQWRDDGLDARVSINLSPREFRHPGLVTRIAQELARHGVPAKSLAVEITESAVIDEFAMVAEQLQALIELGVEVHLDDFGTGHSSLAWLKAFPISTIKIDRSFVRDMVHDANDEAIVRAVIGLGHTLGCSIVAEGVEHDDQLQRLRELRCEAYQGWLFSPALPAEKATALLQCKHAVAAQAALP